ncbi:MAG: hypothetical protein SH807_07565 [Blastochloris sp.]|mgnify:CR=1 FL=1|jgi:Flp pilus assembly protein TadD|nr:hypothetical protein [Blastochloris sp.]
MSLSKKDQQHLIASVGYSELGMLEEALTELLAVAASYHDCIEVLGLKLAILQHHQQWQPASLVAERLITLDPKQADWWIALAYAKRRASSLVIARILLKEALSLFPKNALIHYNLGCYAAQLGELPEAYGLIKKSFNLNPKYKNIAKLDPDLEPIQYLLKKRITKARKKPERISPR